MNTNQKHYPLRVAAIELTLKCNLRCKHCGSTAGKPRDNELTKSEFINLFKGLKKLGCQEVCLLGGEPFLNPDWEELVAVVGELGMRSVIISNGYLITPKIVDKLKQLPGVDRIGISLDGASPKVHDSIRGKKSAFERAVNAMLMLREAGFETGAITTVMKENLQELPKIRDLLLDQDLNWQIQIAMLGGGRFEESSAITVEQFYWLATFIHDTRITYGLNRLPMSGADCVGYFSSYLTEINKKPEWRGCLAGITVVGIESNGNVKACLSLPSAFVEDNIRNRPIEDIWTDPSLFQRNRRFSLSKLGGFCAECEYGQICRGGCYAMSVTFSGQPHADPYCLHALEVTKGYHPDKFRNVYPV